MVQGLELVFLDFNNGAMSAKYKEKKMITLEIIERAGVFVPRSVEVAPLLFSEARNGGVKTSSVGQSLFVLCG